ncbi:hypothetical protein [Gimesia sp.]|uniref:hypothetical protein n=1 Tax=Gimesia sp. TaxID=2024833 RepID=UPI003A8D147B
MNNQLSLTQHLEELKQNLRRKHFLLTILFLWMGYLIFFSSQKGGQYLVLGLMFCILVDTMSQQRLIDTLKILVISEQEIK